VLVTPVAPAVEQKAPPVTVAFVVGAVVFGAAAVVLAVVAALVAGAAGAVVAAAAVVAGASEVAGTLAAAVVAGAVVGGWVVAASIVVTALVGLVEELTVTSLVTGGLGVEVSGFAMAPTAARLRTPPATTPILTLPLSSFHLPARPVVALLAGIR
jgi:hypothetical protein